MERGRFECGSDAIAWSHGDRVRRLARFVAPGAFLLTAVSLGMAEARRDYGEAEIAELIRLDQAAWLRLQPGTVALIEDLAAAGQPLAMLSNAPDELAEAIIELPVAAHFGQLIFSCQLKYAKPDPECYARTLARLGASSDEVIFIDDRGENVAAAAALGLRAVHFSSAAQVRAVVGECLAGQG